MLINYKLLSDEELANRLNFHDKSAFKEIYNRYWGALLIHARRMLKNDAEAEDAVQEVFASLLENMGAINFRTTLPAYLFQSIRFKVINLFHHEKVRYKYLDSLKSFLDQDHQSADSSLREKEMAAMIEREIASLPKKMRAIFELSRKAHLSYKEIAEQADVSEGTVRKQIYYALKILRSKLGCMIFFQIMALILWINRL